MYTKEYIIEYVKNYFSNCKTSDISKQLGICESKIRRIAKKFGLSKSDQFLKQLKTELVQHREKYYLSSIKEYSISQIQRNIIVGSIIGDGSLALYGRSKNAFIENMDVISKGNTDNGNMSSCILLISN